MRNALSITAVGLTALFWCALPHASYALGHADAGAVLNACDHTKNCGYSQDKKGNIEGCSPATCFYCPADGKHQCFQVKERGKHKPGRGTVGGVKLAPLPSGYRQPPVRGGLKPGSAGVNARSGRRLEHHPITTTAVHPVTSGNARGDENPQHASFGGGSGSRHR